MGLSMCRRFYELSYITYAWNGVCTLCGASFWRSGIPFNDLKQLEQVIITVVAPCAACFVVALRQLCVKRCIEILRSTHAKWHRVAWKQAVPTKRRRRWHCFNFSISFRVFLPADVVGVNATRAIDAHYIRHRMCYWRCSSAHLTGCHFM